MSTPRRSNTGLQLSDANCKGGTEGASISCPSHMDGHDSCEPPLEVSELGEELANTANFPVVATEIQKDFLTSIDAGVGQRFPELSFVMSHVLLDSNTKIPVLTISQCRLFVHPPYGMVSRI